MRLCFYVILATLLLGWRASADEQLRRVQEELRKRNLYFGDIDGRKTNETTSAIRRYQEHKGFPQTGEVDGSTLSSLNLAPPDPAISTWPDVPVLKSDAALQLSEKDRKFLETLPSPDPVPIAEPPLDHPTGAGTASPADEVTPVIVEPKEAPVASDATPARKASSPPKPALPMPSAERVGHFVRDYLSVCETNDLEAEMAFYADPLNYMNYGVVGRDFVKNDVRSYYKRWPKRDYKLLDLKVAKAKPGEAVVKFRIAFRVKNPQHSVAGKTDNTFTIHQRGRDLKFTAIKEQRTRD